MAIKGYFEGASPFADIFLEDTSRRLTVLVDTGFWGELMLQEERITDLGLPEIGEDTYTTASGDEVGTTVHVATLRWLGETKRVSVLSTKGNTALLGMGLLFDCSLSMEPSRGVLRITR